MAVLHAAILVVALSTGCTAQDLSLVFFPQEVAPLDHPFLASPTDWDGLELLQEEDHVHGKPVEDPPGPHKVLKVPHNAPLPSAARVAEIIHSHHDTHKDLKPGPKVMPKPKKPPHTKKLGKGQKIPQWNKEPTSSPRPARANKATTKAPKKKLPKVQPLPKQVTHRPAHVSKASKGRGKPSKITKAVSKMAKRIATHVAKKMVKQAVKKAKKARTTTAAKKEEKEKKKEKKKEIKKVDCTFEHWFNAAENEDGCDEDGTGK